MVRTGCLDGYAGAPLTCRAASKGAPRERVNLLPPRRTLVAITRRSLQRRHKRSHRFVRDAARYAPFVHRTSNSAVSGDLPRDRFGVIARRIDRAAPSDGSPPPVEGTAQANCDATSRHREARFERRAPQRARSQSRLVRCTAATRFTRSTSGGSCATDAPRHAHRSLRITVVVAAERCR
jgi:hypothetical protein